MLYYIVLVLSSLITFYLGFKIGYTEGMVQYEEKRMDADNV